jgi:predicted transposase YdaD
MDMEHNRIVSFEEGELKGRNEGRIEGRNEGRIEGRNEGRIEGRNEGRIEGEIKGIRKTAKNMLAGGLTTDQIVQFTGLTSEQVESLRIGG